ncbi:MAG: DUF192 domain-containing protein [Candidatus Pacebacteria bacterium]|jgi:uncharacterized membrane protein (UPF0127 family)|nr:DUF192 domain-containing protein [Candidatus Paceibacterota bacterium]
MYSNFYQKGSSTVFSLILLALVVWAGWLFFYKNRPPRITFESGVVLNVTVANTPELREKGLSKREILRDDEGMLFVFDTIDRHKMWMKDMYFPLDIIWLDENFKIVDINKGVSLSSYPNTFQPQTGAGFAIEVNAGYSDRNSVKVGESVKFERK